MTKVDPAHVPVIISVSQETERETLVNTLDLAEKTANKALEGAGIVKDTIDRFTLVAVLFSHCPEDAPRILAQKLGLTNAVAENSSHGGNAPQFLVNRACEDISRGLIRSAMIVGAETTRSMRLGEPGVDFLKVSSSNLEIEKTGTTIGPTLDGMVSNAETRAGVTKPSVVYPMFENILAKKAGKDHQEQRQVIAEVMSRFTEIAEKNPYAWFKRFQTPEEIATVTESNRLIAEPYTRSMNSFPNVDQSSAILITNLEIAKKARLSDQGVFPWSGAETKEIQCSARPDIGSSPAMTLAANAALRESEISIDDVAHIDFYSCFPSAVEIAAEGLGLNLLDERAFTVTGGLPYFGGPGNNYTTHAIASMVDLIRESHGKGFISANGGFMSKHAAGIYSGEPRERGFTLADTAQEQEVIFNSALPVVQEGEGEAVVEATTVTYDRNGRPARAPIIATLVDGSRIAARASIETLKGVSGKNLIGEKVKVFGSPAEYDLV